GGGPARWQRARTVGTGVRTDRCRRRAARAGGRCRRGAGGPAPAAAVLAAGLWPGRRAAALLVPRPVAAGRGQRRGQARTAAALVRGRTVRAWRGRAGAVDQRAATLP